MAAPRGNAVIRDSARNVIGAPHAQKVKRLFKRQRLFKRLDEALSRPGLWVCGPAGSGKTSLVESYLQACKIDYVWYRVNPTDNDAASFFLRMHKYAEKAIGPENLPSTLSDFSDNVGTIAFSRQYFAKLYSQFPKPLILIFDNVTEAGPDADLFTALSGAMDAATDRTYLFFLSRSEPPKTFARYYASNQLALLGWNDLRYTRDETLNFIKWFQPDHTTSIDVDGIHSITDGWPVGIQILANSSATAPNTSSEPDYWSSAFLEDYYAAELFDKLPDNIRSFLMATAMLTTFSENSAGAITGESNPARIISDLVGQHAFITKNNNDDSYIYQPLFRQFLINQAYRRIDQEQLEKLSQRVLKLHESQGHIESALDLCHAAKDWENMKRLILSHAKTWLADNRQQELICQLDRLPSKIATGEPWLMMVRAEALKHIDANESHKLYENCAHIFQQKGNEKGRQLAAVGIQETALLESTKPKSMDRWLNEIAALKSPISEGSSVTFAEARLIKCLLVGLACRMPLHTELSSWEQRAQAALQRKSSPEAQAIILSGLLTLKCLCGDVSTLRLLTALGEKLDDSNGISPSVYNNLIEKLMFSYFLDGLYDKCNASTQKRLPESCDETTFSFFAECTLCACALSTADFDRAKKCFSRMRRHLSRSKLFETLCFYYLNGWYATLRNKTCEASLYARLALHCSQRFGGPFFNAVSRTLCALAQLTKGRTSSSKKHINKALDISRNIGAKQLEFSCGLIKAELLFKCNCKDQALEQLRSSLCLGRKQSYSNMFFWRPNKMAMLCGQALKADIETDYVKTLILKRGLFPEESDTTMECWPWPIKIYSLKKFDIVINGEPFVFTSRTRKTPILLLKALIAFGAKGVATVDLKDALWPEVSGDLSFNRFKISMYRLRKMLGREDAILVSSEHISLNPDICWVDIWPLEKILHDTTKAWYEAHENPEKTVHAKMLTQKLSNRIKGGFLPEDKEIWSIQRHEQIKHNYLFCLKKLCLHYEKSSDWAYAIKYYRKGLSIFPDSEYLYQRLIKCHAAAGDHSQAKKVYTLCKNRLSLIHGIRPSSKTQEIAESIAG
ncbi:MAG: BTAD domain-containing putative transcriptional regulator [Desulfobacteraceae bacterium]|jgi:two-component SAPR family response regulator